ncbi:MAG: hypothetical protein WCR58_06700 [Bacteroidales bacterium]|jgi:hypothetical protein|nr:hypothetical protein [Bacteroidales bacterium]MDD3701973.1 hypothetical protein [Bacteroidales bacterium]MDY0368963.1 hypothetical protein [Bacteroidales bacterium]
MKIIRQLTLIISAVFLAQSLAAQDKLYTKTNQVLNVEIIEQTDNLLKYRLSDYNGDAIFTLKKRMIAKIEYENGLIDMVGNENPRKKRPIGISASFVRLSSSKFTTNYLMATMGYFIIPQIDLQVNLVDIFGGTCITAGGKFHLNSNYSKNQATPFSGILLGYETENTFLDIPFGVSFIGNKGLSLSLSLNQRIFLTKADHTTFLELSAGWRFDW